jgi:mannose-6-phosphate isomerase-like protein (cupin superfamily)
MAVRPGVRSPPARRACTFTHADDEAWHVLEGTLLFHFADGEVYVPAGGTIWVPAGVPHTYESIDARYLIVLTPRIAELIRELQRTGDAGAARELDCASWGRRT